MKNIVILGGGCTGLGASHFLAKNGFKVKIFEADSKLGGLVNSFTIGNTWIESYYHHIFTVDNIFLNLAKEIGVYKKIVWKKPRMGLYYNEQIKKFDPISLFSGYDFLNLSDKIKFLSVVFNTMLRKEWQDLDEIPAKDWLIQKTDKNIYSVIFEPLLKARWGKYYEKISAAWFWGRMRPRALSRSKFMLSEKLGYMFGSFKTFFDALVKNIFDRGAIIGTNIKVTEIKIKNNSIVGIKYKKNKNEKFIKTNRVLSTLPPQIFLELISDIDTDFRKKIEKIKYRGVLCSVLSLKEKLSDIYWLNICSKMPFDGIIEHTNFFDSKDYNNQKIIYLFNYVDPDKSPLWKMTEKDLFELLYINGIKKIFPKFRKNKVNWFKTFKSPYATPIYEMGFYKYMPKPITPIRNLYFAGIYMTYPMDRNMNIALESGIKTAKAILGGR